jgi:hypothetical protein
MKKVYLIQIIRYGNGSTQTLTITDDPSKIEEEMIRYNQFRGGKYPAYYVTEINLNEFDLQLKSRTRYDIYYDDGTPKVRKTGEDQLP